LRIRIGTRGSRLARTQTGDVARLLAARGHEVEIVFIKTAGDRVQDRAFAEVGAPGIFVAEIEAALLEGRIDLAVHSYKDLPSKGPEQLIVAAVPERLDPADRLLARPGTIGRDGVVPLPAGARVGSASARRRALLQHYRPGLEIKLLRGNLPTRVDRLRRGDFDAILLAAAGISRLDRAGAADPALALDRSGVEERRLDPALFVPAPSQGAIAVQVRRDDAATRAAAEELDDAAAHRAVRAERALQARVEAGCQVPFGAWCRAVEGALVLTAVLEQAGRLTGAEARGSDPAEIAAAAWDELQRGGRAL